MSLQIKFDANPCHIIEFLKTGSHLLAEAAKTAIQLNEDQVITDLDGNTIGKAEINATIEKSEIQFVCEVMKWHDHTKGNTFYSCKITRISDGAILTIPLQYGSHEVYRHTSLMKMIEAGWVDVHYEESNNSILWIVNYSLRYKCVEHGEEKCLYDTLDYYGKRRILDDLASKIYIWGSSERFDQYIHIGLKKGRYMNNVKSILRKYFDINYYVREDEKGRYRYAEKHDIIRLCRIFLRNNCDIDLGYYSHHDPRREKNTIAKVVYQYGEARYDLL